MRWQARRTASSLGSDGVVAEMIRHSTKPLRYGSICFFLFDWKAGKLKNLRRGVK